MVIRAGVDDRQMTSALGVSIQSVFAIAFVVGSALAAFGGVVGASQGNVASGQDGPVAALLARRRDHRHGVAPRRGRRTLLYGLVFSFAASYPPTTGNECRKNYAIVFTFVLLALVPAFRLQGLFGRSGEQARREENRGAGHRRRAARRPPWTEAVQQLLPDVILPTQALLLEIAAASLIFLSAYGGMVSLRRRPSWASPATCSGTWSRRAGRVANRGGLVLGWTRIVALVLAIVITRQSASFSAPSRRGASASISSCSRSPTR